MADIWAAQEDMKDMLRRFRLEHEMSAEESIYLLGKFCGMLVTLGDERVMLDRLTSGMDSGFLDMASV